MAGKAGRRGWSRSPARPEMDEGRLYLSRPSPSDQSSVLPLNHSPMRGADGIRTRVARLHSKIPDARPPLPGHSSSPLGARWDTGYLAGAARTSVTAKIGY